MAQKLLEGAAPAHLVDGGRPRHRHASATERHCAEVGRAKQFRDLVRWRVAACRFIGGAHQQADRRAQLAQLLQEQEQSRVTANRLKMLLVGDEHSSSGVAPSGRRHGVAASGGDLHHLSPAAAKKDDRSAQEEQDRQGAPPEPTVRAASFVRRRAHGRRTAHAQN